MYIKTTRSFVNFDKKCNWYILTYLLAPSTPLGHRPPTRDLQASRSWAFCSSCLHVHPILLVSASRSRRHVFLGRPLFLLPWGFQVSACLVRVKSGFRSVWPIHFQRRLRISSSAGSWFVLCHRSCLLILFGQRI